MKHEFSGIIFRCLALRVLISCVQKLAIKVALFEKVFIAVDVKI